MLKINKMEVGFMKKISKFLIATLSAIALSAGTAFAFQGLSIGVVGNVADFDTDGHERIGATEKKTAGSASKSVDFPSFFVEYTAGDVGAASLTIGFEHIPGEASLGAKSRTDDNTVDDDDGTYTAKAEVENHSTIYVEPGYQIDDMWGVYAKGGISQVTVNSLESIAQGDDSSTYGNEDIFGYMYGIGLRANHENGLFMKLEGTQTIYETVHLNSTTGNANSIRADIEQTALRLALGYNF